MDGDTLYSIGDLARRTGLTVKTIRFYSDRGIVAPTGRSPAGYRLYDIDAVARLDFVRTLRALGLDLPTIRKVVDRELPPAIRRDQRLAGPAQSDPGVRLVDPGIACPDTARRAVIASPVNRSRAAAGTPRPRRSPRPQRRFPPGL